MAHDPTAHASQSNVPSPFAPSRTPLVLVGGALGVASVVVGFLIFLTACAGFDAALKLSVLPVLLGFPGFLLVVFGGVVQKGAHVEDTHVLAGLFLTVFGTIGGLLEVAGWQGWRIFH